MHVPVETRPWGERGVDFGEEDLGENGGNDSADSMVKESGEQ